MKRFKITVTLVLLLMLSNAFAAEPTDTSPTSHEWQSLVKPMMPIGERMVPLMSNPDDPLLRQEL